MWRRLVGDSTFAGTKGEVPRPWGSCRSLPNSSKSRAYSPVGWGGVRWPYTSSNARVGRRSRHLDVVESGWPAALAHVTGLRGDEVAPQILGMNKIISDESLRRALSHLAPNQASRAAAKRVLPERRNWQEYGMDGHGAFRRAAAKRSVRPGFSTSTRPSNCSTATRRAEVGYNPTKPGRPVIHCTPTGSAICVWCLMWKCKAAKPLPGNIAGPGYACCSNDSLLRNVPSWCAATSPSAMKA